MFNLEGAPTGGPQVTIDEERESLRERSTQRLRVEFAVID
jgi:hypothetical protein